MASLTGKLVADTYKALLKLIDNDILTASEKQISDGFGGGSGVFIDQNGFLRASQYKVTGGNSSQFLKGDGSLDSNTYLSLAAANALYLPIGSTTSAIAEGTRLYFTTARVLATTLTGFVATSGTVTASDTVLSSIEKIWWNIENGGGGGGGGYVPYIGATQDLNLGTYGLISDFVQFNTTNSAIPVTAGTMSWNNTDGTADLKLKGGNVTLQVGQEQVTRVVNKTGVNLLEANYQAVYISGAQGQRLKVDLALATTDGTSAGTLGLVTENINNNQEGFVTSSGLVNEIDTTGDLQGETWADGDILYLSPLVAGDITNVKPLAPDHTVIIGFVVYAHAIHGKIYVKVDNGYEIEELHDVQVITRTDTDILQWYEDDLVWRNIQFATALDNAGGIIGLGDINYVPRFDGTNSISNSRIFDDLENVIIGGTVGIIPNPYNSADMLTVLNGNISVDPAYAYHIGTYQILYRQDATGEFRIGTNAANDFTTFYANGSERVRITTAGYLGVGLTAPSSMIHAKDSTAYGKIIIDNTGLTGGGSFSARQNGTETAIFGVSGAWQANTTSDAAIVATRAGQGIKFYTNGSSTAKGGIDSVGNSFIGQLPAYYTGATNFIVQGISAAAMIGVTHMDNSIKGVFSTLNGGVTFGSYTPHPVIFTADDIESARIASDGKWLFGTATNDNVNLVQINGSIIATTLKKTGGIATEFLKADGTVDNNTYYLASNPSNFISLTSLSSTAFGLTYTNTTGVFSLTAGFEIPTTTDTTNWDIAYLNRITSATAPLSITSNVISISQASGSTNGYLSSTDWTTFNNKSNTNGTVTSVSGAGTVSGLTLTGTVTTTGSLTLGGTLSLTSLNVTTALGFTPVTNARTLTINGTTYDLTADRSWTIAAGISTLTTLGTSGPATLVGSTLNVPNYSAGASAVRNVSTFIATSGQTTFTIIGGYTVGLIDVFINGARLSTADYTATNSSTVVLGTGAVLNDIVDVVNYTATFTAGISGTGTANYITKWTGTSTVNNSLIYDNGTNVGISTSSPAYKLDVNGTGRFSSSFYLPSLTTNYIPKIGASGLISNSLIFDNGNNIGIGNTNPFAGAITLTGIGISDRGGIYKLLVNDTIYVSNNLYYDGSVWKRITANGGSFVQLESVDGGAFAIQSSTSGSAGSIATLNERFRITNIGNINLLNNSHQLAFYGSTNFQINFGQYYNGTSQIASATQGGRLIMVDGGFNFNTFSSGTIGNTVADSQKMTIKSNGEVGIATSSTSGWALTLGALGTNGGLNIIVGVPTLIANFNNTSNNPTNVRWGNYNGNFYDITNNPSNNSFTIDYNDTERFRISSTGAIGIGNNGDINNAGVDKLSIGHFNANYGWIQSWGGTALYLNKLGNAVYAGTQRIDNNSDARIKTNIQQIKNALNTVLSLNGKKYNMLDEDSILRYGFIAQEVEPHLSDFVTHSNRKFEKGNLKINNLMTLENSGTAWAALLVEAIKELKSELDQLKTK